MAEATKTWDELNTDEQDKAVEMNTKTILERICAKTAPQDVINKMAQPSFIKDICKMGFYKFKENLEVILP